MKILALVMLFGASAEDWKKIDDEGGITFERRTLPGASFPEGRLHAHSPLPPKALFDVAWNLSEYAEFVPFHQKVNILKNTPDEIVGYIVLKVSGLSARDYTIKHTKAFDAATGTYRVFVVPANDQGPPENKDNVRVSHLQVTWTFAPAADGKGTDVTYQSFIDMAGSVPSWIVNSQQKSSMRDIVKAMLKRAEAKAH